LDGPNPLVIERISTVDQLGGFGEDRAAQFERTMPGKTLDGALAAGQLYRVDYRLLREALLEGGATGRDTRWRDKYLPAPLVLLCDSPGQSELCDLVLVAIRVDQPEATGHNPVYWRDPSPSQGERQAPWRLAKTYVLVADFNLQAMCSHIYRHHFFLEPIALATKRQLARQHPLRILLDPHIAYTNAVNHAAYKLLAQRGSVFDQIYAGRLMETRRIMQVAKRELAVEAFPLAADVKARNVVQYPVDYPFRDDASAWWTIIRRFVDSYIGLYYESDDETHRDSELMGWLEELSDERRGALSRALQPNDATRDNLGAFLTHILFSAGPGHAAVHYPQTDYFTYAPNFPAAAYQPPPRKGEHIDEERIERTLPPFARAAMQFFNNQIACYRFDRFGDYRSYPLGAVGRAKPVVDRLRVDLLELEVAIELRNRTRPRPYRYLLPSLVPNSINI
jgi:arachidonate 15-lipoxygenase